MQRDGFRVILDASRFHDLSTQKAAFRRIAVIIT
jgi:hypothetical protein